MKSATRGLLFQIDRNAHPACLCADVTSAHAKKGRHSPVLLLRANAIWCHQDLKPNYLNKADAYIRDDSKLKNHHLLLTVDDDMIT